MKRVILMGSPRSGTTWVGFLLSHLPGIVCLHHATMFPYLLAIEEWRAGRGPLYTTGGEPQQLDGDVLDCLLAPVAAGVLDGLAPPGTSVVVDKTPENVRIARSIHRVLPSAYFLHVVRDPRAVFASQKQVSGGFGQGQFPTRAADGAFSWRRDVRCGTEMAGVAERYLHVRYEDLQSDGPAELQRIFEWLGVAATPARCAEALAANDKPAMRSSGVLPGDFVRSAPGWRSELSDREVSVIEYVCGDEMRSLGYEPTQHVGAKPLAVRVHEAVAAAIGPLDRVLRGVRLVMHRLLMGRNPPWAPELRTGDDREIRRM